MTGSQHSDQNDHDGGGPVDAVARAHRMGIAGRTAAAFVQSPLTPLLLIAFFLVGLLGTTVVAAASAAGHAVPAAAIAVQATDLDTMTPAALAAWSPPIAGLLASLGFLLHLEDG